MNKSRAIAAAVLAYVVAAYFAAEYVAGAALQLLNKTLPHDVTLSTWGDAWATLGDDPAQRKRLIVSAAIAGGLLYVVPLLAASAVEGTRRSLHGDARFAQLAEIRKAGLFGDDGIIVGRYNGEYLMFGGQQFALVAAPTRSGKGVAVVVPNLLNFNGSVVVLDIKLENFRLTSGFRRKSGQQVYLFSPFAEDGRTHRWNPLDGIDRDQNLRVGDALAIGQALYPSITDEKVAFWNDQARNLFLGLTLYLLETPELPCTLGELLRQSSGKGKPLKDHLQGIVVQRASGPTPLSEECMDALNRFCGTSENTLSSILATFNAPLTIFANPIVDAATSASDFDISSVRKRRMSIYVGVQPNRLGDASLLVNLFFSQLINLNTKELPANNPALRHKCLIVLDEFSAPGRIGILAKSVAYIAGYNLRLLPIFQSMAQLEAVYGEKDARTFATNHAMQIIFPPREQKDANAYSEMLGYFTEKARSSGQSRPAMAFNGSGHFTRSENVSDQRRALMLPQELRELDQSKQIVILENTKPILCDKVRYFDDPAFIDRLKTISPTLRRLGKRLPSQAELEYVAFVGHELSAPTPVLDVDLHRARTEKRVRALEPGEAIDLAKLAIDVDSLPQFEDSTKPTEAELNSLVEAFMVEVGGRTLHNESATPFDALTDEQPEGDTFNVLVRAGNWLEAADPIEDAEPVADEAPPATAGGRARFDLAVLDA